MRWFQKAMLCSQAGYGCAKTAVYSFGSNSIYFSRAVIMPYTLMMEADRIMQLPYLLGDAGYRHGAGSVAARAFGNNLHPVTADATVLKLRWKLVRCSRVHVS